MTFQKWLKKMDKTCINLHEYRIPRWHQKKPTGNSVFIYLNISKTAFYCKPDYSTLS